MRDIGLYRESPRRTAFKTSAGRILAASNKKKGLESHQPSFPRRGSIQKQPQLMASRTAPQKSVGKTKEKARGRRGVPTLDSSESSLPPSTGSLDVKSLSESGAPILHSTSVDKIRECSREGPSYFSPERYSSNLSGEEGRELSLSERSMDLDENELHKLRVKTKLKLERKPILNESFAKCAYVETDPFWIPKLVEAAHGKVHKVTFRNNMMVYRSKMSKPLTLEHFSSYEDMLQEIKNFYHEIGQFFSRLDQLKSMEIQRNVENPSTLKELNTGKKNQAITEYVNRISREQGFTNVETNRLTQDIHYAILRGVLDKADVLMKNKKISSINNAKIVRGLLYIRGRPISDILPDISRGRKKKKKGSSSAELLPLGEQRGSGQIVEGSYEKLPLDYYVPTKRPKLMMGWKKFYRHLQ